MQDVRHCRFDRGGILLIDEPEDMFACDRLDRERKRVRERGVHADYIAVLFEQAQSDRRAFDEIGIVRQGNGRCRLCSQISVVDGGFHVSVNLA